MKNIRPNGPKIELFRPMWWKSVRCEILELLGEGAQGSVFKALRSERHSGLRQTVAIKILHSRTAVKTWQREFESLARVRSPYCVQVLSFERFQGRPALVLEYVDGLSMAQLGQAAWLSPDDIQEIGAQLESALRDLHRQKIFHGDLSPQNVLIDRDGRVRVLDFGLANSSEDESRLTPAFAAPERLMGAAATVASDLFSLGRVLQFLGANTDLCTSYLGDLPTQRTFRASTPCEQRQSHLAQRIRELLARRQLMLGARTQSHVLTSPRKRHLKASLLGGITSLLILATSSASQLKATVSYAQLVMRTRSWHFVQVDGLPLGYAPISISLTSGVPHQVTWISAAGRGERTIVLKPGELRTLEDSDFSH